MNIENFNRENDSISSSSRENGEFQINVVTPGHSFLGEQQF